LRSPKTFESGTMVTTKASPVPRSAASAQNKAWKALGTFGAMVAQGESEFFLKSENHPPCMLARL
jgi:hypothetical protein